MLIFDHNPFPHTTNLQQTTLKTQCHKAEKSSVKIAKLLNKVKNIVAKGEIARFEQFLILSKCFQKSSAASASKCTLWAGQG